MTEEIYEIQTFKVLNFFRLHPGMVISLSYVLLTICGIFYSWSFYREFDVAILKLANISDLLTAGISEPAAILMFLGGVVVAIASEYLSYYSHQYYLKWKSRPEGIRRWLMMKFFVSPTKSNHMMIMLIGIFFLYAQMFVSKYAEWQSEQIKEGIGDKITISSDALAEQGEELLLLGSTSNFVFAYSQTKAEVTILPIENIQKMTAVPEIDESGEDKKTEADSSIEKETKSEPKELDAAS